jgi:hypothetical protein
MEASAAGCSLTYLYIPRRQLRHLNDRYIPEDFNVNTQSHVNLKTHEDRSLQIRFASTGLLMTQANLTRGVHRVTRIYQTSLLSKQTYNLHIKNVYWKDYPLL